MKPLKFRLIKDGKIVGFEHHGGGDIFHKTKNEDGWFSVTHMTNSWVDHDSKDQYTGLNDKNATEIYEGDIVKTYAGYRNIIIWRDDCGGFYLKIPGMINGYDPIYYQTAGINQLEVIGNIHENTELLEEKK